MTRSFFRLMKKVLTGFPVDQLNPWPQPPFLIASCSLPCVVVPHLRGTRASAHALTHRQGACMIAACLKLYLTS